ncbi:Serine/threonine-protein kinase StkP [Rosistilla oblonga]|nr:Serine/threonine-protein kinase StkP [Rosistilla oblonga]
MVSNRPTATWIFDCCTWMIKSRQKLGKYQIEKKLGEGGFAGVYRALDTIEGVRVALKIPYSQSLSSDTLEECLKEVRMMASLDHPHILSLKNAEFIEGHFVLAFPLAEQTLGDRITKRMSMAQGISYTEQMLEAVSYAHQRRIIHCDLKPENMVLFANGDLRLTDFGIAKIAMRTLRASGSGTVGYIAPEQAMGRPSFRSDVFSLGLVLYRVFSGKLPEWPFAWPPPNYRALCDRVSPEFVEMLRRSLQMEPQRRYRNATQMLSAFRRLKARAILNNEATANAGKKKKTGRDWRTLRYQQFLRNYGKVIDVNGSCKKCKGPVAESMIACPWCSSDRQMHVRETRFPQVCPRCEGGMKLDWSFCPWCEGPEFELGSTRSFTDKRYTTSCDNEECGGRLMPFMRFCPWCDTRVQRTWNLTGSKDKCRSCGWGVSREFWSCCPWCATDI